MTLLKLLSWPYFRKHRLRSLLTVAGIVLGIAVFTSMHSANQAVLGAFNRTVERIAGKTDLQVSAGESGFEEEVLERVQSLPQVRVAAPVIEAVVDTGLRGQGSLLLLAVDMTGDQSLRDYNLEGGEIDDPLVFLAQPDSILVTREFAARNNLQVNSRISMHTMAGPRQFTIRGLMKPGGLASAFGGNLAVMDIYAAQVILGRGRRFDRIDVAVKEGVPVAECQGALRRHLGPGLEVEPPESRGKNFEALLKVYEAAVNLSSWFALFIGMFIIYNSFSIAVTQRRAEIGILRALGATQGQIRTLFLWESAVAGLIGSLLGIALGVLLAQKLAGFVSQLLGAIFGVTGRPDQVIPQPALLAASVAIGVLTSMAAALVPARAAARVDPVKALNRGAYQVLSAGESRARAILAALCSIASLVCMAYSRSKGAFYTGYILINLAALLLTPWASLWITRTLRPLLKRLRPVEGSLAADSLIAAPRRTSATVAALMLSLAMVVGLGGIAAASYESISEWIASTFNPDLFLSTSEQIGSRTFRFPASMTDELRQVPGVAEVQPVRTFPVKVGGAPVVLVAIPMAAVAARTSARQAVQGDFLEMHRIGGEGKGLVISENLAQLQALKLGQTLDIPTPSGWLRLPVAGVLRDYSGQQGTVFLDSSVYLRYWKSDAIDIFRVYLQPGARSADVKQRILERFSGQRRLFVLLNKEVKDFIFQITDQWFGMTYVQIFIAVLVAVLGIVNTLTVSIADRRRELGVLRAVGGLASQIRHTIWLEAAMIAAVGLILGLSLGAVNLYYQLEMSRRDFSGMTLDYRFPWTIAAALLPVIAGAALAASIGPAEAAVRGSLVEALEYE